MIPTITAFARSPDGGQGQARDMRVRWALEEVGQPYDVRLVSFSEMKEPAHRALHPFGQIPTYEEGDLVLFESGAIVLHIAARHAGLLPDDAKARARAITWMFAALNTVEPPILDLATARVLERDEPWYEQRLPVVEDRVRECERLANGEGALVGDARAEVFAAHVFHRQVRKVAVHALVIDMHDAGVSEASGRLGFATEPRDKLARGLVFDEWLVHRLERDLAL